jgi:heme/copper-type cytochrome/quinol oxidase subunit 1
MGGVIAWSLIATMAIATIGYPPLAIVTVPAALVALFTGSKVDEGADAMQAAPTKDGVQSSCAVTLLWIFAAGIVFAVLFGGFVAVSL